MSLNPKITKDTTTGMYWLEWTPDPTAEGYAFNTPLGWSRTFNAELSRAPLGVRPEPVQATITALDVTARAPESASYPPVAPPPVQFGANLFDGFEWAKQEITGTTKTVTTNQELASALASGAEIIDGQGHTFNPGQVKLSSHSSFRAIVNAKFDKSRVLHSVTSKWRLRGCEISGGIPEDNVKGDASGLFLDVDQCVLRNAPRQGMLLYPHGEVVLRRSRIHHNGSTSNGNQDHGIYTGVGAKLLWFDCAHWMNVAYQAQLYPHYKSIRGVCNTLNGGITRGGVVIGSENSDPPSDIILIGFISANSPGYGFERWQAVGTYSIEDAVCWNNRNGDFGGLTGVRPRHGDPKFKDPANGDFSLGAGSAAIGVIDSSRWGYVPATDINGKARVTADAGAWAA